MIRKKEVKKKMTIDKLAVLMKAGFGDVNKKVDNAIDLIDKLAASTLKGFAGVDKRFESIEARMATKDDVEEVKDKIDKVNKRMDDYAETKVSKITYKGLERRVDSLEKNLK